MPRKPTIVDKMMNEAVCMCGFPQIIVTRGWMYQWLRACGWSPSERGFGSLDYCVFAATAVDEPLTDETDRDRLLNQVRDTYIREIAA